VGYLAILSVVKERYPASAVVLNGFLLCLSTRCNLVKHLSYAE